MADGSAALGVAYRWGLLPGREKFCPGKLTFGKILPGKNYVPELKKGGKILSPQGLERVKRKFGAKHRRSFGSYFLSMTRWNRTFFKNSGKNSAPRLKTLVKIRSRNFGQKFSQSLFSRTEFFPPWYRWVRAWTPQKTHRKALESLMFQFPGLLIVGVADRGGGVKLGILDKGLMTRAVCPGGYHETSTTYLWYSSIWIINTPKWREEWVNEDGWVSCSTAYGHDLQWHGLAEVGGRWRP